MSNDAVDVSIAAKGFIASVMGAHFTIHGLFLQYKNRTDDEHYDSYTDEPTTQLPP